MNTEGPEPQLQDRKRKVQQFKRGKRGSRSRSRNTYSRQAIEQAENMRNHGETG